MTPTAQQRKDAEELLDTMRAALKRNGEDSDHCMTLVTAGAFPREAGIRPTLFSVNPGGSRIYGLTSKQVIKFIKKLEGELA